MRANENNTPCVLGTLTINPGATVELLGRMRWAPMLGEPLAYTTPVNIAGGTLDISAGSSATEGLDTTFNLTGGTMSASGGGMYSQTAGDFVRFAKRHQQSGHQRQFHRQRSHLAL